MGNTVFYREAGKENSKITWKDIFSESFRSHTRQERDYAMTVGTSLRPVNEETMLQTWQKPWLWFYYGKFGVALILLLIFAYVVAGDFLLFQVMPLFIPPLIVPMIIMVFLWELNIPQNISVMELLIYFLVGGVVSLIITSMLFVFIPGGFAPFAAFREEPAKLIPSVFFLWYFEKKKEKKIWGLTGLVIGGAIGAGFSGFESIQYAFDDGFATEVLRAVTAVGSHMLYCAPYVAALALAIHKHRCFSWKCLLDKGFLAAFAIGTAFHAAWNSLDYLGLDIYDAIFMIVVIIVLLWVHLLYWVRKCLTEVVNEGHYVSGSGDLIGGTPNPISINGQHDTVVRPIARALRIECIAGSQAGRQWGSKGTPITIGRSYGCSIQVRGESRGVSWQHCIIQNTERGWTVKDLDSSYGTYVSERKLVPGEAALLSDGEIVHLGSKLVGFRVTIK